MSNLDHAAKTKRHGYGLLSHELWALYYPEAPMICRINLWHESCFGYL